MDKLANDSASLLDAAAWYLQLGKIDRAEKAIAAARLQGIAGDLYWNLAVAAKRMQGNLAAAINQTREWLHSEPASSWAHYTLSALTGQATNAKPDDGQYLPVPFVLFEDFLPDARVEELREILRGQIDRLKEAQVFVGEKGAEVHKDMRRAHVTPETLTSLDWFLHLVEAQLPKALTALYLKPFPIGRREIQLTASYDGEFYKAHRDYVRGKKRGGYLRRLTYVYYFGLPGGAFSEGHLRLYDTDRSFSRWRKDRFTALVPRHNRLVLFNSEAMHEVMPVKAPGGRPDDGRFTVNGWFNVTPEAGEMDLRLDP